MSRVNSPSSPVARTLAPLVLAAVAIAIAEGASAARGSLEVGAAAALAAGALVAGVVSGPAIVAALVLGWIASRSAVRALGRALVTAVAGEDERTWPWAIVLQLGLAGVLSTWASIFARRVVERATAQVAALVAVLAGAAALAASVIVAAMVVRPMARGARRLVARLPRAGVRTVHLTMRAAPIAAVVAAIAALDQLLPPAYFAPLAFGLAAFVAARLPRAALARPGVAAAGPRLVAAAAALSAAAYVTAPHADADAKLALLYRAPLASTLFAALRAPFDADGDGYAAALLGGDCDDHDPTVHPGALDPSGDGIDQDCMGVDARPFVPAPAPPPSPSGPAGRPNVVLVHLDALRPDHLGMNGYVRATSPSLDRFASEATRFRDAYTPAPGTRFALASVFTGLEVARVPHRAGPGLDFTLLPEATTIAESLADRGYDTFGLTLSEVAQHVHGIGQGFRAWATPWPDGPPPYAHAAERTTDAALAYLASRDPAAAPYFLFVHYGCTHSPYVKDAAHDFGDRDVDVYDSALAHCDDQLGRLLAALDARADRDRTAIVLYSDHGELFGEHGFDHHGTTLFEPDVRVLLVARLPGGRPRDVDDPVTLADLGPTVRALAGVPETVRATAWSLVPFAHGEDAAARPVFLSAEVWNGPIHFEANGVVEGGCKLLRYVPSGVEQLFDLTADPHERREVRACGGEPAARFRALLDGWSAYIAQPSPGAPDPLSWRAGVR